MPDLRETEAPAPRRKLRVASALLQSKPTCAETLRDMEGSGLIERQVESVVPPAVSYRLTALGRRFVEPVELLYAWGRANADALDQLGSRPTARRT